MESTPLTVMSSAPNNEVMVRVVPEAGVNVAAAVLVAESKVMVLLVIRIDEPLANSTFLSTHRASAEPIVSVLPLICTPLVNNFELSV